MRFLIAGLCVSVLSGCAAMQPAGFPKEMSAAFGQIGTSLADQSVWQEIATRLGGQVIEPGVEGYAGVLYVAGGRLTGTSGQLSLEGDGSGLAGLSPAAREAVVELAQQPDLLERFLAWVESQASPDSPD